MTVVALGPADCFTVASTTDPEKAYLVVRIIPCDAYPNGAWRCNCFAGQLGNVCTHVNQVKAKLGEPFRAKKPTRPTRPNLVSINGGVA